MHAVAVILSLPLCAWLLLCYCAAAGVVGFIAPLSGQP
jgi:hypothetical protein